MKKFKESVWLLNEDQKKLAENARKVSEFEFEEQLFAEKRALRQRKMTYSTLDWEKLCSLEKWIEEQMKRLWIGPNSVVASSMSNVAFLNESTKLPENILR